MGFKATIHLGDSTDRARSLVAIKKYGLKGLLQHHGSALEQLGVSYVQPYAENRHGEPMLMPAEARLLQVVRPSAECGVMLATT